MTSMSNSSIPNPHQNWLGLQVTTQILTENPNWVFVFGDNTLRRGIGGAAKLRYHPQAYGFITKKYPTYEIGAFYTPQDYVDVYKHELQALKTKIEKETDKIFLISLIGAGLANKFKIFEKVIQPSIKEELNYPNVRFLW